MIKNYFETIIVIPEIMYKDDEEKNKISREMKYRDQILEGLNKISTPSTPGTMIVTDESQAVITCENTNEVIFAACKYKNGRIIAAAHDYYIKFITGEIDEKDRPFSKNLKLWLSGDKNISRNKIISAYEIRFGKTDLSKYKIIVWDALNFINGQYEAQLIQYLASGGSLFCCTCPWGWLQLNPGKELKDMQQYNFLKKFGMTYTDNYLSFPDEIDVPKSIIEHNEDNEENVPCIREEHSNHRIEILNGLDKISTPSTPGTMIVTDESQAVITCENTNEVIFAACKYKNGRIIAAAHDYYIKFITGEIDEKDRPFSKNLKLWLSGDKNISRNKIISAYEIRFGKTDLSKYKIIVWDALNFINGQYEAQLIQYLASGGSIFCCACPWGWLQLNPGKELKDMQQYNFLKKFGMIYTAKYLSLPEEIDACKNTSEHTNFSSALENLLSNHGDYIKCMNTVLAGLDNVDEETELLSCSRQNDFKMIVQNQCAAIEDKNVPSETHEICDTDCINSTKMICRMLNHSDFKAPGIDLFPGDFKDTPKLLQNVEVELSSEFCEIKSTGYYLPAGVQLQIECSESHSSPIEDWFIRIGAHDDDLSNCETLSRWPCIVRVKRLKPKMTINSAFGGLIYFESKKTNTSLRCTLNNLVESPYYDLTLPNTVKNWESNSHSLGLWAELAGKYVIFTTPSKYIRHIKNPRGILEFWDSVIENHHKLRGTNPKKQKRERVVNDQQPVVGYMHSGYPIVTQLDCCQPIHNECIFDLNKLQTVGNWGLFHEFGHNMQRDEWTFDGSVEITVNLFSLHAFYTMLGQDVTEVKWLRGEQKQIAQYFQNGSKQSYDLWQEKCGVGLYTFALLIKHFGWQALYTFLDSYEDKTYDSNEDWAHPTNNQEKIDQWVIRYSKIIGYNIKNYFTMFGLPVSTNINQKLAGLESLSINPDPKNFFTDLN